MNEQLAQEAADYAADYREANLKPVPVLCKHVCPTHNRGCSWYVESPRLREDQHFVESPNLHVCSGGGFTHNFYSDTDMYGNHTRKEGK